PGVVSVWTSPSVQMRSPIPVRLSVANSSAAFRFDSPPITQTAQTAATTAAAPRQREELCVSAQLTNIDIDPRYERRRESERGRNEQDLNRGFLATEPPRRDL